MSARKLKLLRKPKKPARLTRLDQKAITTQDALLAARLYREGKDQQEIERLTGIPPDRQGQAVARGLRLLYGQSP